MYTAVQADPVSRARVADSSGVGEGAGRESRSSRLGFRYFLTSRIDLMDFRSRREFLPDICSSIYGCQ